MTRWFLNFWNSSYMLCTEGPLTVSSCQHLKLFLKTLNTSGDWFAHQTDWLESDFKINCHLFVIFLRFRKKIAKMQLVKLLTSGFKQNEQIGSSKYKGSKTLKCEYCAERRTSIWWKYQGIESFQSCLMLMHAIKCNSMYLRYFIMIICTQCTG